MNESSNSNTDSEDEDFEMDGSLGHVDIDLIAEILEFCLDRHCNKRNLSVLIFSILRNFSVTFRDAELFLSQINCMSDKSAAKQLFKFKTEPLVDLVEDGRELTKSSDSVNNLIRSERMVRNDLKAWGYEYKRNSKRPYFLGHERQDVVNDRNQLIDYFVNRKEDYYKINENLEWIFPEDKPTILIFHDESTFRSCEQYHSRWLEKGYEPFLNKGRGRSLMISDFLVSHPSSPFFFLAEEQWNRATKKYPSLLETDGIHYDKNTCTGSIKPGQDSYFESDTILSQFERLFQMLEFKTEYQNP
ncbi:unnamed protein product, partial [Brachionus calyciflorus]